MADILVTDHLQKQYQMGEVTVDALQGQTIVMVTHDTHAAEYADRVVRLRDGRIEDI